MLNKVMIIGRLGQDPELRYTQTGAAVCTLNVATDESYTDSNGNKVAKTEWHRVQVWGRSAENCSNYLRKGSLVYAEGSLTTRKWQDQQGNNRYTTEIKALRVQFMDRRDDRGPSDNAYDGGGQAFDGGQGPQGGAGGYKGQGGRSPQQNQNQNQQNEDMGPAFPSEASGMDDMPF